jgi:hypothetical protein
MAQVRVGLRSIFGWLLRWTASAKAVPRLKQTAWQRAKADTSAFAALRPILFGLLATVGAAAVGLSLPLLIPGLPPRWQVLVGVIGAGLGFVLVVLACAGISWLLAPVRQRDEARAEVDRLTEVPDADVGLFEDFDAFLAAARATEPQLITPPGFWGTKESTPGYSGYCLLHDEWWRKTISGYHTDYRVRAMAALKGTKDAKRAGDPTDFGDLDEIHAQLKLIDLQRRSAASQAAGAALVEKQR